MRQTHPIKPLHLIAVMGPTATGKSALAEALAEELNAQLVNADAFQVYRGFDIGTAKPANRSLYKLLDLNEPNEPFGVGEYVRHAEAALHDAYQQGKSVVLVGGSGLYTRAVMDDYQDLYPEPSQELRKRISEMPLAAVLNQLEQKEPEVFAKIDHANVRRVRRALEKVETPGGPIRFHIPPFEKTKFALFPPIEENYLSIQRRSHQMLQAGWAEEVQGLLEKGVTESMPAMQAIGYRTICDLLRAKIDREEAIESIVSETSQFAKRQRTWLRAERNLNILDQDQERVAQILQLLQSRKK